MRTMIFSAVVLISTLSWTHDVCAQGTLQFNQVIVVILDLSNPFAFTVPANKVWKIESAGSGYYSSTVYMRDAAANRLATLYTNNRDDRAQLPYWLPSGFAGDFIRFGNTSSAPKATVSIIEFNVIP